jgi:hypothetical protein
MWLSSETPGLLLFRLQLTSAVALRQASVPIPRMGCHANGSKQKTGWQCAKAE